MPNYGVIDLGSNSIRLVVYEVKDDGQVLCTSKNFKSLINDKVMAGLSAYVVDGAFTEAGVARAISVLKGHSKRARYFNCKRLDVFATAVVRNASNCREVTAEIAAQTGLPIALLSCQDEAHLGFVGATCDRTVENGTLVDIGGGSTEITRIAQGHDFDNTSIGQGSLSSFAEHVHAILPTNTEMQAIDQAIRSQVAKLPQHHGYHAHTLYGIGGSVRAAAKLQAQAIQEYARPKSMTKSDIHEILEWCQTNPDTFAHAALKASAERVHTLVPGCVILHALFDEFGAERLEICKYGVREGYLIERMLS